VLDLFRAILARRLDPAHRLLLGQLVMFTGIAALFPVVPLYVASHGGTSLDIALFIAGPMIANTLVQVPAGQVVDRIGRKPVLIGSRLVYAVFAAGLFIDRGPLWLLGLFRIGQGMSGGAYVPALRAALADVTPVEQRGRRYSQLQACEMVGLLAGPAIGGAIALWRYSGIFAASGIAVLLGVTTLFRLPETRGPRTQPADSGGRRWWLRGSLLVPGMALAAVGAMFSMYDVVWPQYLNTRGYNSLVIGLSISLFAVPILLLAGQGGKLSDRSNKRLLVPAALTGVACCAATYPLLRSLPAILGVGSVEALAFLVLEPTLFSVISQTADPAVRGRAMGVGGFLQFGGSAVGAGVLGALYGVAEPIPFLVGAAACLAAAGLCAVALPRRASAGDAGIDLSQMPPSSVAIDLESQV
jgi:DHA1 family multidrug resistance protein-like MFS transporter